MTISTYLSEQLGAEFEGKILELARSDSFSAIASGVGTRDDREEVCDTLIALGVPVGLCPNDESLYDTVKMIASWFVQKTK